MTHPLSEQNVGSQPFGLQALLLGHLEIAKLTDDQLRVISPLALAYIGDAVYELFIRSQFLFPPQRVQSFHRQVVSHVRAEQQACYLEYLRPHLTEAEADILRRGRNAVSSRKQRASLQDYQQATALEALIGYLYLTDPQRLADIFSHLPLNLQASREAVEPD